MESWMHRVVARQGKPGTVLEVGAGTLNHLPYEADASVYDIIEPFEQLYVGSSARSRVRHVYHTIDDVPETAHYDRIISIAVLEHLDDLPYLIARSGLLLSEKGIAQHAIPSEGGALWGLGWRMTTGIAYRLRNNLSYVAAMRHEHINTANEIIVLLRWFFEHIEYRRFPLPFHHGSLYAYVEAAGPRRERCIRQLAQRRRLG
jgi:hypothetical protein